MLKRLMLVFTAFTFIATFAACSGNTSNTKQPANVPSEETVKDSVYMTISPDDAKDLIGKENVILLDVRTREEYEEKRIPGAVLLPVDNISQKAGSVLPDKDSVIIVYCRSGRRSKIASEELIDMGYKTVYDLGGIIDWPYDTVSG